jgi:phosphonate dehydrogenase
MRPNVILSHYAMPEAINLLSSVCDVTAIRARSISARADLMLLARHAHALMVVNPQLVDEALLAGCRRLKIVACAFKLPEHIDVAACTRRGIWVSNVITYNSSLHAELEAARNILDVMSGDTPRNALNEVLQPAA